MTNTDQQQPRPSFQISGQYVKDLSFENPGAPASFVGLTERPNIHVDINLGAQKLNEELFEVAIKLTANAESQGKKLYVAELVYAGLFTIKGVPEEKLEPILFVDCPFVLFPYARRVISDVTRDGGFVPLQLDPIDFFTLYRKRLEAKAAAEQAGDTDKSTAKTGKKAAATSTVQ